MEGNEAGERFMFRPDYGMQIIKEGPILRESDACIWIMVENYGKERERRFLKSAGPYFDAWQDAKDHIVRQAREKVARHESNLAYAKTELARAEAIVQPAPPATPPMQAG